MVNSGYEAKRKREKEKYNEVVSASKRLNEVIRDETLHWSNTSVAIERLKKAIEELCIEVAINAVYEGLWGGR